MAPIGRGFQKGLNAPLRGMFAVTPSDSADLAQITRQVYAAGAGKVSAIFEDGTTFAFSIAAGERVDVMCVRIKSTGTTATGIEAGY